MDGGYDEGYKRCACFWGNKPGKLVEQYLLKLQEGTGMTALDLGCGEGKNTAVDCSNAALENALANHGDTKVTWMQANALDFLRNAPMYDLIVMYGLMHCMQSEKQVGELIRLAIDHTNIGGADILVAFNDGPHDLSAHPDFKPLLLSHENYVRSFTGHTLETEENEIIHETHPHNGIPHFHSLTRLVARKKI
jgi:tellurite methyltransferase